MDKRESEKKATELYFNKEVLQQWEPLGLLGAVSYNFGRIGFSKPIDPPSLTSLDAKAQNEFKSMYPKLWNSWLEAKKPCEIRDKELLALYAKFHCAIISEVFKQSGISKYPEIGAGRSNMNPNREWRQVLTLCHEIYAESIIRLRGGKHEFEVLPEHSLDSEFWYMQYYNQKIVQGLKGELDRLEKLIEKFLDKKETKSLIKKIEDTESNNASFKREAAHSIKQKIDRIVREIDWKYKESNDTERLTP